MVRGSALSREGSRFPLAHDNSEVHRHGPGVLAKTVESTGERNGLATFVESTAGRPSRSDVGDVLDASCREIAAERRLLDCPGSAAGKRPGRLLFALPKEKSSISVTQWHQRNVDALLVLEKGGVVRERRSLYIWKGMVYLARCWLCRESDGQRPLVTVRPGD